MEEIAGAIYLPDEVRKILSVLKTAGYEAYIVGGCLRDSLMGKEPADYDIATSALPFEIKALFKRTVDTGIAHGTVSVIMKGKGYELTTFRSDGAYSDHRHPEGVSFSDYLEEDLSRRDFTINAMAYSPERGLIDLFGGRNDLSLKLIRAVGEADERFSEDALRMLRAVRFSGELDFDIEEKTREAIRRHAEELCYISRERVLMELSRLICSAHIERLSEVFSLGLAPYIAPHFDEIDIRGLCKLEKEQEIYYNIRGTDTSPFDLSSQTPIEYRYIRFAFVCRGMEPEHVNSMLRNLRADNETVRKVSTLIELISKEFPAERYELKKLMSCFDEGLFRDAVGMKEILCGDEYIVKVRTLYEDIVRNKEPVYLRDLAVTGDDLKSAGIQEGPELGSILRGMLDQVQRDPKTNERNILLKELKNERLQGTV